MSAPTVGQASWAGSKSTAATSSYEGSNDCARKLTTKPANASAMDTAHSDQANPFAKRAFIRGADGVLRACDQRPIGLTQRRQAEAAAAGLSLVDTRRSSR